MEKENKICINYLDAFTTERLLAQKITLDDFEKLKDLHTNPLVAKTLTGLLTEEQIREKLKQYLQHWEKNGFGLWVFYHKDTKEWVGRGGLNRRVLSCKEIVEIAYAVRPKFWGNGFATEIAQASLAIAFEILCFDEIFGFVLPKNIASQRVMQKVGLKYFCKSQHGKTPCLLYRLKNKN